MTSDLRRCCGTARGNDSRHKATCFEYAQIKSRVDLRRAKRAEPNRRCCATRKGLSPHAPSCVNNAEQIKRRMHRRAQTTSKRPASKSTGSYSRDFDPDWESTCEVCGASPVMPATGMCGPCSTGEAETIGGNW